MSDLQYPDLSHASILAVDTETYDPKIEDGPGVFRRDGKVLGVSLSDGVFSEYYPIAHYDTTPDERARNVAYIRDVLALPVPKVGANIMYDLDWLTNYEGIDVKGPFHDVQIAEPLLDEYVKCNLGVLGNKYLGHDKKKTEIDRYCEENGLKGDARKWIYKMPSWIVREYAKADAYMPIQILKKQMEQITAQELGTVYDMEMALFPLLLQMRKQGTRVSVDYVKTQKETIRENLFKIKQDLYYAIGHDINPNSSAQVAKVFDTLGIAYAETEKGNASIGKDLLDTIDHPTVKLISAFRKNEKALSTFFENSFTYHAIDGRIHTQFFPMKGDENGTVSGRFSSANPNLQQIPARDKVIGPMCRRAFIPEADHFWGKLDFSQIEYRVLAHFAIGPKADDVRARYTADAATDYHQMIMDLTGLERKPAKNLNFGLMNGMGVDKAARMFGWSLEYAREVSNTYHARAGYVKRTMHEVGARALQRGYIKTIMGRRAHLAERGKEYKMFNRLIQGSAADVMKKSMVNAYDAGLFNVLKPHLTVHDELDVSVPRTREGVEALIELKHVMETCVPLKVPIIADLEVGKTWADLTELNTPTAKEIEKCLK